MHAVLNIPLHVYLHAYLSYYEHHHHQQCQQVTTVNGEVLVVSLHADTTVSSLLSWLAHHCYISWFH